MLQDPAVKPPDAELDKAASSRSAPDRRQKPNGNSEQALNCPRCDSTNTKFCYYNNYSLSQPRHFCKNCRRYWTRGGTLRNVPIGGGCRKNKRVKQRSADPSSLVSLDESASSMLASINNGNCSSLLPNFSAPPSAGFGDLSSDSHMLSLAFSRIQESLRLGEKSGAGSSNPALFGMGGEGTQSATALLNSKCSQSSLINSMPGYDNGLVSMGYASSSVKPEYRAVMYNGSDLTSMFQAPTNITGSATATLASLEDQLSAFGVPVESFNGCNLESQLKFQHQKQLALQLMTEAQGRADRGNDFEDETHDHMRRHTKMDSRSMSTDWQQEGIITENLFDPTGDHQNFWSHSGWPDMHTVAGSTAGAML